ncbi:glycoside hydrolase family 27 protein [Kibdelosporangium aridum]|uniref:Alpha-galactosidase n=1 Tax=Kibdelosporangium aridum TaxID=2030 RepID=A0A1Y5Y522_KIBAR|nr:glycoside hydrolase family 27 protein [Kibdelosporangium aridum]SMD23530.1 Alpha galactosidase A [Kibdelosporangium aridum]
MLRRPLTYLLGAALALTVTVPASASPEADSGYGRDKLAALPYMGWSSWSMQSSKYPGLNPKGDYSWLSEANVIKQTDAVASKLKRYGYEYINMDAGWWADWAWNFGYDEYGRPTPNKERFPRGMKWMADYIHEKGLKAGIYIPVGLAKGVVDNGDFPVKDAPGCSTHDLVYPDKRTTNGWDSSYKIDFSNPCSQKYIDSIATMFADWGYDFLKIDGVGPGSWKSGPQYDNRDEIAAYRKAFDKTGRKVHIEISWSIDINYIEDWKSSSNGWRIDTDVECYCSTLVTWESSVNDRWKDLPPWIQHSGPGGWHDLDTLNVGNGEMDGLTVDERYSYMTFWAITASPLYVGDDVTKLDDLGVKLLTNREVLALNQQGRPAKPVDPNTDQPVWWARNKDGSYTVALFNLGSEAKTVRANWQDFGFDGRKHVRDVWADKYLGKHRDGFEATIPPHGTKLLKVW